MNKKLVFNPLSGKFDFITDLVIPASNYTHQQSVANNIWNIIHNLGFNPAVTVIDSGNNTIVNNDVNYINLNQLSITFAASFTGKAYLS